MFLTPDPMAGDIWNLNAGSLITEIMLLYSESSAIDLLGICGHNPRE